MSRSSGCEFSNLITLFRQIEIPNGYLPHLLFLDHLPRPPKSALQEAVLIPLDCSIRYAHIAAYQNEPSLTSLYGK